MLSSISSLPAGSRAAGETRREKGKPGLSPAPEPWSVLSRGAGAWDSQGQEAFRLLLWQPLQI